MLKLEDINPGAQLQGLVQREIVRVVSVEPVGPEAGTVYSKGSDGKLAGQMLFRADEARLSLAEAGRAWAFDAPADGSKLGLEAYRIRLAHLFDPMTAVHTSNVQPLPHQTTAVYQAIPLCRGCAPGTPSPGAFRL
jgi:hypothetical protein